MCSKKPNNSSQEQAGIAELFAEVTNSNLTDSRKTFLGLKLYEILNEELNTSENVISNCQRLGKTPPQTVKEYKKEFEKLKKFFSEYYAGVFEQMYEDGKISFLEKEDLKKHYDKGLPWDVLQSDRSTLQKKIKAELRGFSGSVRGAGKLKYWN